MVRELTEDLLWHGVELRFTTTQGLTSHAFILAVDKISQATLALFKPIILGHDRNSKFQLA